MASKPTAKKKPSSETSSSIVEQTEAFLEGGGEIQYINSGVSGQQSLAGPKHITLGNSKPHPQQPQSQTQAPQNQHRQIETSKPQPELESS